jgi:HAD superfamily hydrolase (TIGR01450 family)
MTWTELAFEELIDKHRGLLFDAYGVLVDAGGALGRAGASLERLSREGRPWLVVTNDASRSPERASRRFCSLGLEVEPERVLSAGAMLTPYFKSRGLVGARCVVLGTGDSTWYVQRAGGVPVEPDAEAPADALVVCDEQGFDFFSTMDEVLSMVLRGVESGRAIELLVPNPDLIYPAAGGRFGFTAGSIARMLEEALALRLGADAPRFTALGKPSAEIFRHACDLAGTGDCVMLGDQLHTDVAGARAAGLSAAIVLTGVTSRDGLRRARETGGLVPDYVLPHV